MLPKADPIGGVKRMREAQALLRDYAIESYNYLRAYQPPPSPKYKRTYRLMGSWEIEDIPGGYAVRSVGVPYAHWVRGPRQAGHMKRRGWESIADYRARTWPPVRAKLRRILGSR